MFASKGGSGQGKEGKYLRMRNNETREGDTGKGERERERSKRVASLVSLSEGSPLNGRLLQSFPVLARTGPGRGEKGQS